MTFGMTIFGLETCESAALQCDLPQLLLIFGGALGGHAEHVLLKLIHLEGIRGASMRIITSIT